MTADRRDNRGKPQSTKSTSAPTGKMRRIAKRLSGDLASVGDLLWVAEVELRVRRVLVSGERSEPDLYQDKHTPYNP